MAWLWTAASISQVSQQCLTMQLVAAYVMCVPDVMLPSSCLVVRNTNMVCVPGLCDSHITAGVCQDISLK